MHFSALRVLLAFKISIIYKIKNYTGDHILYNYEQNNYNFLKLIFSFISDQKVVNIEDSFSTMVNLLLYIFFVLLNLLLAGEYPSFSCRQRL